jgi:beta-glucanase (GH16 family)
VPSPARRHLPALRAVLAIVLLAATAGFFYSRSGRPRRPAVHHPPIAGKWILTFDDEFNSLNRRTWQPRLWWNGDTGWPTDQLEVYRPSGVRAARGLLVLTARRSTAPLMNWEGHTTDSGGEPFSWTSGFETSGGIRHVAPIGFAQRYGYFEARIKMPLQGAGFWPAFWLQGVHGSTGSLAHGYDDRSELDVVEVRGFEPNTVWMHLHGVTEFAESYDPPIPVMGGGFHTYGVDWERGHVAWFFDGKKVAQYNGRALDNAPPHYVMLDFAVGGAGSYGGAANSSTPSRASMLIDYVRVWRH